MMIIGGYRRNFAPALALALSSIGCGSNALPPELASAREAYTRASQGKASELAPAQLDTAKQALQIAETSFSENGGNSETKDRAYVAQRRAEISEVEAEREEAARQRAAADKEFKSTQLESLEKTQSQLEKERRVGERTRAELATEKQARAEAEKKAAAAMATLAEVAKVKEESRGVVITLSGAVLFATGQADLLPIAKGKLDEVARALKDQGYKTILVEGHTDSRGSAAANDALSLKRAESVRSYLVSRGIETEKISAAGLGSARPVADNNTADGRAENRRVEIVVNPNR